MLKFCVGSYVLVVQVCSLLPATKALRYGTGTSEPKAHLLPCGREQYNMPVIDAGFLMVDCDVCNTPGNLCAALEAEDVGRLSLAVSC